MYVLLHMYIKNTSDYELCMLTGSSNSSLELKKVKPPNKKKHEDEVESLQNIIKEKEGKLVSLTIIYNYHIIQN